jgi:hypothetical protein
MSQRTLIQYTNDVELWKVSLYGGGGLVDEAFCVKAPKQTPEVFNFDSEEAATAKFEQLVAKA